MSECLLNGSAGCPRIDSSVYNLDNITAVTYDQTACTSTNFQTFIYSVFKTEFPPDGAAMSSYNVKLRRVGIADYDAQIKGRKFFILFIMHIY